MKRYVRLALTLPPHVVARRALIMFKDRAAAAWGRRRDARRGTFAAAAPAGALPRRLPQMPAALVEPHGQWVLDLAARYGAHCFNVLGSGWVRVRHGMDCAGVEGHRYESGPVLQADAAGEWLRGRVTAANLPESRRLWALTDAGYQPIDWHLDIKSGYRWAETCWYRDVPYGHKPGVDIKTPWELGRLQHLTVLAWAHKLRPLAGHDREFRNQVLDFLATNPPRFGVNWRCTMDVGIRAANLALAWDLFAAAGASFDAAFAQAVSRSLLEHVQHIVANLEWYPEGRGNHYLADVAGLLMAAAWLPDCDETRRHLDFAQREILLETALQFLPDGANFEASIPYHRLSAEMVAFSTALLAGLSRPIPPEHLTRLLGMARFSADVRKPSGLAPQIGDNDSGRFFKLQPMLNGAGEEQDLDHRHLLAAIGSILGQQDLQEAGRGFELDSWVAASLAGRVLSAAEAPALPWPQAVAETARDLSPIQRTVIIEPGGDGDLRKNLRCQAWPAFGLWLFRSDRLYLALRCGPIGQNGRGGHAHNDQLAVELSVDGVDWITDPGAYLYTPLPQRRDQYRSAAAHFAPQWPGREPGRLDLGAFWLGDEAKARCIHFGPEAFVGEHQGFGQIVRRRVVVEGLRVVIVDSGLPGSGETLVWRGPQDVPAPIVAFSPGYGRLK